MRKEFFNIKNLNLDLYLVNCGYEDCCADFVCAPHKRNYYLIHYITKGSGYYEVNGQRYALSMGDVFIIYPGQLVTYYSPDINDTWSFCWIGFSGKRAADYMKLTNVTEYTKNLITQGFYSTIMNCINYIDENDPGFSQLKLNSYVLDCLFLLTKEPEKKAQRAVDHVDKAVRYIEYNYMNEITPKDVSAYLNLDRTYFFRIFKKYTGSSPEKYIMNYRIKRSLDLLKNSDYSISEIAVFVGFRDVYYFSRVFKKVMNVTPSEYRK
ncbi:MAG: AraC family transcriptional regulator [Lachnospiraceae bacterium]|nr:AraC family transcriptional regulator [Lachnospiraceae bacterium]